MAKLFMVSGFLGFVGGIGYRAWEVAKMGADFPTTWPAPTLLILGLVLFFIGTLMDPKGAQDG